MGKSEVSTRSPVMIEVKANLAAFTQLRLILILIIDGWKNTAHKNTSQSHLVTSDSWSRQEDDGLHFLSREEQECLQFFEKTIDSLEESLEENDQQPEEVKPTARSRGVQEVDGHLSSTPSPSAMLSTLQSRFHTSKDHDIIDLVRPQPNLVQSRAMDFNPTSPGSIKINGSRK